MAGVMSRRLFGTDGVRGVAGSEITAALALGLGRAAILQSGLQSPRVLVVRDTRESGEMLEAAMAAGLASAGAEVLLGGVLPTPAASLLIRRHSFDLGVVLSASHNVYSDNGIKFFGDDGFKLSDEREHQIEAHLDEAEGAYTTRVGRILELHGARALHARFQSLTLSGIDVLLDCANGATYRVAPEIFERLGASVSALAVHPDGRKIDHRCSSTPVRAPARGTVRRARRRDRGGRRAAAVGRAAPHGGGAPARSRHRDHGHDHPRLRQGAAAGRHRGGKHGCRGPLRARGAPPARLGPRGRAVWTFDRARLCPVW